LSFFLASHDNFYPELLKESISVSDNGSVVAAEVNLTQIQKKVGDFWSFKDSLISRLAVYDVDPATVPVQWVPISVVGKILFVIFSRC
jgi:hypothetical protein